jgi:hypothetical protein
MQQVLVKYVNSSFTYGNGYTVFSLTIVSNQLNGASQLDSFGATSSAALLSQSILNAKQVFTVSSNITVLNACV